MGEFALIEEIRRRCAVARDDVTLGIGDDAALLQPRPGSELAVSTDTLVDGCISRPAPQRSTSAGNRWP